MKTVVIQIGNTDDKLTQKEWSCFIRDISEVVNVLGRPVYFSGGSNVDDPWQNYCIVAEFDDYGLIREKLSKLCRTYKQDSIAVIVGNPVFVTGGSIDQVIDNEAKRDHVTIYNAVARFLAGQLTRHIFGKGALPGPGQERAISIGAEDVREIADILKEMSAGPFVG